MIVSVDPGKHGVGVAVWSDEGKLVRAAYLETPPPNLRTLREALNAYLPNFSPACHGVVELPQVYSRDKSKAPPMTLIELATVSGAAASLFSSYELVLPATWKKQTDTEVIENRLRRDMPEAFMRISPCPKKVFHNVVDAMGLGAWWFKQRKGR